MAEDESAAVHDPPEFCREQFRRFQRPRRQKGAYASCLNFVEGNFGKSGGHHSNFALGAALAVTAVQRQLSHELRKVPEQTKGSSFSRPEELAVFPRHRVR